MIVIVRRKLTVTISERVKFSGHSKRLVPNLLGMVRDCDIGRKKSHWIVFLQESPHLHLTSGPRPTPRTDRADDEAITKSPMYGVLRMYQNLGGV